MNTMLNVWWMVREEIKIGVVEAQEILNKYGFTDQSMPIPSDRTVVRRGIDAFHNRRGKDRRVVERIHETSGTVVFGLLKLNVDEVVEKGEYEQDTRIHLNKDTGTISAEGLLADDVQKSVDSYRGSYNSDDIRTLCRRVINSCGAISKRPTGGVYILPSSYMARIENLKLALGEMTGKMAVIYTERIFDGEEEKAVAANSVYEDLTGRIEEVMKKVRNVGKQACRLAVHKSHLEEINELANTYREILGEQCALNDLGNILKTAENTIVEALQKLTNPMVETATQEVVAA